MIFSCPGRFLQFKSDLGWIREFVCEREQTRLKRLLYCRLVLHSSSSVWIDTSCIHSYIVVADRGLVLAGYYE
jgi:hypothetical protein